MIRSSAGSCGVASRHVARAALGLALAGATVGCARGGPDDRLGAQHHDFVSGVIDVATDDAIEKTRANDATLARFRSEQFDAMDRLSATIDALVGAGDDEESAATRARLADDLSRVQIASMAEWPVLHARVVDDLGAPARRMASSRVPFAPPDMLRAKP